MIGDLSEYHRLAELHKPHTAEGIRAAALELARSGLSDHDIGHVLQLDANQVRTMIAAEIRRLEGT